MRARCSDSAFLTTATTFTPTLGQSPVSSLLICSYLAHFFSHPQRVLPTFLPRYLYQMQPLSNPPSCSFFVSLSFFMEGSSVQIEEFCRSQFPYSTREASCGHLNAGCFLCCLKLQDAFVLDISCTHFYSRNFVKLVGIPSKTSLALRLLKLTCFDSSCTPSRFFVAFLFSCGLTLFDTQQGTKNYSLRASAYS